MTRSGWHAYPGTAVEEAAREEGMIADEEDLLFPRFYLARGLEGWLGLTVRQWMIDRPYCTM